MKQDTDTWYVMADGTHAHPGDVKADKGGVLKNKSGMHVALRDNGLPLTSGIATKENARAAQAGKTADEADSSEDAGDAANHDDETATETAESPEPKKGRVASPKAGRGKYETR